ncbi:hypothetical protein D3C76_1436670 [compost metagenome]
MCKRIEECGHMIQDRISTNKQVAKNPSDNTGRGSNDDGTSKYIKGLILRGNKYGLPNLWTTIGREL